MRDITLAAVWLPLAHAFTLGVLGGQYALVKGKIRYSGVWSIYLCVQAVLLGCTGLLLYLTPISPPIAAVSPNCTRARLCGCGFMHWHSN